MKANLFGEDSDATAELPQLDIRIISAALERVERPDRVPSIDSHRSVPDWKHADQLAGLQDQVASLQATLTESENRYTRLSARHDALLQKLDEHETHIAGKQYELNQATARLTLLEQQRAQLLKEMSMLKATCENLITTQHQIEHLSADQEGLKQLIKESVQQRKQRHQFILKQAREIKRLRELNKKTELLAHT